MSKFNAEDEEDLKKILSPQSGVLAGVASIIAFLWFIVLVIAGTAIFSAFWGLIISLLAGGVSWLFQASNPRDIAFGWFIGSSIFLFIIRFITVGISLMSEYNAEQARKKMRGF